MILEHPLGTSAAPRSTLKQSCLGLTQVGTLRLLLKYHCMAGYILDVCLDITVLGLSLVLGPMTCT